MQKETILINNKTVLVLGGRGFIGRYIVKHLKLLGAKVVIGTRFESNHRGFRQIKLQHIHRTPNWVEALEGIDVVVNTVGILRQRKGESYDTIHNKAVKELANQCKQRNVRIVHISALGLTNPLLSRFSKSKYQGELSLKNSGANWAIVRPSLVDGEGGYGARWFQRVARWPIQFIPANATGVFAPIDADDLGEAVAKIALLEKKEYAEKNRVYELAGNQNVNVTQYLELLRPNKKRVFTINVPAFVARVASHMLDILHLTPFSFGHYELLKHNNLPMVNRLEEILNRPPVIIGAKGLAVERKHKEWVLT